MVTARDKRATAEQLSFWCLQEPTKFIIVEVGRPALRTSLPHTDGSCRLTRAIGIGTSMLIPVVSNSTVLTALPQRGLAEVPPRFVAHRCLAPRPVQN